MKAKPYQVSALSSQIQKIFKGSLVFGPDFGVVQEVSEQIARQIVSDLRDTFCVIKITPQQIKETPSLLLDEGNGVSLMGGRKLIWVKDADNTIAEAVSSFLSYCQTDAFLLLSAGNLPKNAVLRTFCESNQSFLSVACYADEAKDVAAFIHDILGANGIQVQPDALGLLVERLSENRLMTRRELDKLITYLGDQKSVSASDVRAVITDTSTASTDSFCCAVGEGNQSLADKEYHLMLANGENPVGIIRILSIYFNRLLEAAEIMSNGGGVEAAVKKILRPAQFRLEASMRRQIQIWKKEYVLKVLFLLLKAERQAKSTGLPAELILDRVIMQIAGVAKRHR